MGNCVSIPGMPKPPPSPLIHTPSASTLPIASVEVPMVAVDPVAIQRAADEAIRKKKIEAELMFRILLEDVAQRTVPVEIKDLVLPFRALLAENGMLPPESETQDGIVSANMTTNTESGSDSADQSPDAPVEPHIAGAAAVAAAALVAATAAGFIAYMAWRSICVSRSVGSIKLPVAGSNNIKYGSGFLIAPHVVMTNVHTLIDVDKHRDTLLTNEEVVKLLRDEADKNDQAKKATITFVTGGLRLPDKNVVRAREEEDEKQQADEKEEKDEPEGVLSLEFDPYSLCLADVALDVLVVAVKPTEENAPYNSRKLHYTRPHIARTAWQSDVKSNNFKVHVLACKQRSRGFFEPGSVWFGNEKVVEAYNQQTPLFYETNTVPEASGGLVLDSQWKAVGIHRGHSTAISQPRVNTGQPIHVALRSLLRVYTEQVAREPMPDDIAAQPVEQQSKLKLRAAAEAQFRGVIEEVNK